MEKDDEKIKLDDSVLEDIDTDIDDSFRKPKEEHNIFDEEISIDDLFDFKPKGSVGDEEDFLNSSMKQTEHKPSSVNKYKTKKQKIEAILNDDEDFVQQVHQELKEKDEDFKQENKIIEQKQEFNKPINQEDIIFENNHQNIKHYDEQNETSQEEYDPIKIRSLIESSLYICGNDGVSINDLKRLTNLSSGEIKKIMKQWINELDSDAKRGLTIKIFGERYKLLSKACNREDLSKLITVRYRNPLSSKVMETLAIIAYNQPCTRSVIENIRAKDPTVTIQKLIDLGLVIEAGRADTPGRPLLYTVTHKFYDIFGIKNLNELPKINVNQPFEDTDVSFFDTTRYND